MHKYFHLLRVNHWVKNLFIFTPIFFSGELFNLNKLTSTLLGFISFSFVASAIYIMNDINDKPFDQKHPVKKNRPIANGSIKTNTARIYMAGLVILGFSISLLTNHQYALLLLGYLIINILYTYKLKHIAIIDIVCIALGFVIRVLSGGILSQIKVSSWLLIMTFLLAIFLALGKRRDDLLIYSEENKMKRSIDGYNLKFIDNSILVMVGVLLASYFIYVTSQEIITRFNGSYIYLSSFFVVIGILRYLQIIFVFESSGSPTKIVLKDRFIQLSILAWIGTFLFCNYA